jgi:hypothetical protein
MMATLSVDSKSGMRSAKSILLVAAPTLSLLGLRLLQGSNWAAKPYIGYGAIALLIMWSPLFFSFPALLLQGGRDKLLTGWSRFPLSLVRGLLLVPVSILSPKSTIRQESFWALLGFGAAVFLALTIF